MKKKKNANKQFERYIYFNHIFIWKKSYDSVIPLKLYTCWHTKHLPPLMKQNYEKMVIQTKNFKHFLFDDNDCREFIKTYFPTEVFNAYNKLIPSSYKSDLWRYCVLYINGGIYMDIKFTYVNGFRFLALTEKEYFVRDRNIDGTMRLTLNGLIAVKPCNNILLKCINQIVKNVENNYYGLNCLDPTGPGLLGKFTTKAEKQEMELFYDNIYIPNFMDSWVIIFNNTIILRQYDGYRKEQTKEHYSSLWNKNKIYVN
jgi:mannosyltransferase OCH1-like enzyme